MIKIEHMRQFLAVSQHNSLSEAAKSLHRSPSAVSMTLKHIEEYLGKPLFEGERKQKLTPLGKYMSDCATRAVTEHQKAVDDIVRFANGESGCVKVSAVPSVATHLLPLVIANLYKKHADIQVDLRDIDSLAVAKTVSEGASDFGIASLSPHSINLKTELLTEEPFMCICPKDHPLARINTPLSWEEIAQYPFIANVLVDQINHPQVQMLAASAQLRMRNLASLIAFIEAGFGVTLLPRMAASLAPGLRAKPLEENTIKRQLYLLQLKDRSLSSAAHVFKEEILQQVKKLNS
jgi:DNA-binding transcriptional LysR family regulator